MRENRRARRTVPKTKKHTSVRDEDAHVMKCSRAKSEQRYGLSLLFLVRTRVASPLNASQESSADIAIYQQVDDNDDGNNAAANHGKC